MKSKTKHYENRIDDNCIQMQVLQQEKLDVRASYSIRFVIYT